MNSLINIMSVIGVQKTLIIACGDFGLHRSLEFNDRVFFYFLPEKMLQRHDVAEQERIQYFIESKGCTQIVFVGTLDATMVSTLNEGETLQSLRAGLKFNLKLWFRNHEIGILRSALRDQLLVELHVITQCNYLMNYYFVRERVDKKKLQVRGVVADLHEENMKSIFTNGISYNDIVSSN